MKVVLTLRRPRGCSSWWCVPGRSNSTARYFGNWLPVVCLDLGHVIGLPTPERPGAKVTLDIRRKRAKGFLRVSMVDDRTGTGDDWIILGERYISSGAAAEALKKARLPIGARKPFYVRVVSVKSPRVRPAEPAPAGEG